MEPRFMSCIKEFDLEVMPESASSYMTLFGIYCDLKF